MRESNFAFPAQNKACVCISNQLYDRRALDTSSSLPLHNSLQHLTYLTSTSPRIREIMTMDGGLERLVSILHDFCICPPQPENPTQFYGLLPVSPLPSASKASARTPTLNPAVFDKQAAHRFSLAFQSLVNIGVRGSENIRSRVVQAGTLEVVGCILEAWLVSRGFGLGPPTSTRAPGRGSGESGSRSRRALEAAKRPVADQDAMDVDPPSTLRDRSATIRPASSTRALAHSLARSIPPAPSRTSNENAPRNGPSHTRNGTIATSRPGYDRATSASDADESSTSRPDTETEADEDGDVRMTVGPRRSRTITRQTLPAIPTPADFSRLPTEPFNAAIATIPLPDVNMDNASDGLIANSHESFPLIDIPAGTDTFNLGLANGLGNNIALTNGVANDDLAMGAPPGAPGAFLSLGGQSGDISGSEDELVAHGHHEEAAPPPRADSDMAMPNAVEATPRAGSVPLPDPDPVGTVRIPSGYPRRESYHDGITVDLDVSTAVSPATGNATAGPSRHALATVFPSERQRQDTTSTGATSSSVVFAPQPLPPRAPSVVEQQPLPAPAGAVSSPAPPSAPSTVSSPYTDSDVLIALQLLAYLSKYPHVRQAFYKTRAGFHPVAAEMAIARAQAAGATGQDSTTSSNSMRSLKKPSFLKVISPTSGQSSPSNVTGITGSTKNGVRQTNVFSLVERFTWRPSSSSSHSSSNTNGGRQPSIGNSGNNNWDTNASLADALIGQQQLAESSRQASKRNHPTLPPEIQYWAGVIMRNACRKDDSRGGIRQCANMLCGRWETYPREFAKCRRCRKAKYCGKECQSTAWSEGHRFWCSAKDADEDREKKNRDEERRRAAANAEAEVSTSQPREAREPERRDLQRQRQQDAEQVAIAALAGYGFVARPAAPNPMRAAQGSRGQQVPIGTGRPEPGQAPIGTGRHNPNQQQQASPLVPPSMLPRGHPDMVSQYGETIQPPGRRRAETVTGLSPPVGYRTLPATEPGLPARGEPPNAPLPPRRVTRMDLLVAARGEPPNAPFLTERRRHRPAFFRDVPERETRNMNSDDDMAVD